MAINTAKLYNFYLWLVSFVAIIAIWINLWVVLTSVWSFALISDEEFLQNREYYKLEECESNNVSYDRDLRVEYKVKERTPEEIVKCKEKVRKSVSSSRNYELKETFISSWAWFIVFLILFWFHYPKFLRDKS